MKYLSECVAKCNAKSIILNTSVRQTIERFRNPTNTITISGFACYVTRLRVLIPIAIRTTLIVFTINGRLDALIVHHFCFTFTTSTALSML